MRKLFAATVIATVLVGLPFLALAGEKTVEGTIQNVDPSGRSITLVGGQTLRVASNVSTESLQPGEDVTIMYQDDGNGDPVVVAVWIDGLVEGGSGS